MMKIKRVLPAQLPERGRVSEAASTAPDCSPRPSRRAFPGFQVILRVHIATYLKMVAAGVEVGIVRENEIELEKIKLGQNLATTSGVWQLLPLSPYRC